MKPIYILIFPNIIFIAPEQSKNRCVTKWIRSPRITHEVLNMKSIILLLSSWILKLFGIHGQKKTYFKKRHLRPKWYFSSLLILYPHFVKAKTKSEKWLALAKLQDIIILKGTYNLIKEMNNEKCCERTHYF